MRERIAPIVTIIAIFIYYITTLFTQGLNYLQNDIIFALISASSILLLPALISKVILKRGYFGIGYVVSTLIYPFIYALVYILNRSTGLNTVFLYNIASTLVITLFLFLLSTIIIKKNRYHLRKVSLCILAFFAVILLTFSIRYLLKLDNDSLLSLDFLQHNVVSVQMGKGQLCITPNQCSSLFKKLGYTTYFHTIQTVLTIGAGVDISISEVAFNIIFMAISTILIAAFLNRYLKDKAISFLAALIPIFTFELGAYSFNFLIPQTFILILFFNLLVERNLNWKKILVATPIMLSIHFVFGIYFLLILFAYNIFFNPDGKNKNRGIVKVLTILSLLGVIVTFVANYRGLSVEKLLQMGDVDQLGFYTNLYYPDNLQFLLSQYGPLLIPLVISIIYFLLKKKEKNSITLFSIFYISISLSSYFLGPTYANKFLLGSTVFSILLITVLLKNLRTGRFLASFILISLFLSTFSFYLLNFQKYNTFYTQNSGKISATTENDIGIVKHLNNNDYNCQILSDPYTQIIVASNTRYDTAGGHYQELSTRNALANFITTPSEKTYEDLIISKDITNRNLCILLSSRLFSMEKYMAGGNIPWLNSMYEYEVNNNYGIPDIKELGLFLLKKDYEIYYLDSNYRLLLVNR